MRYLKQLEFLDLSNNKLSKAEGADFMPTQLVALKLQGNPLCKKENKYAYRKDFVLKLGDSLTEIDRLEVQPAEKLSYKGLLPKMKIGNFLADLERKTQVQESSERLDSEIR